jgi:hypothetical protein
VHLRRWSGIRAGENGICALDLPTDAAIFSSAAGVGDNRRVPDSGGRDSLAMDSRRPVAAYLRCNDFL